MWLPGVHSEVVLDLLRGRQQASSHPPRVTRVAADGHPMPSSCSGQSRGNVLRVVRGEAARHHLATEIHMDGPWDDRQVETGASPTSSCGEDVKKKVVAPIMGTGCFYGSGEVADLRREATPGRRNPIAEEVARGEARTGLVGVRPQQQFARFSAPE